MLNTWTCIEVGSKTWTIWQVNRKGSVSPPKQIVMPTGKLWKLQSMANLLASSLSGRKILFLLNISSTIVKLSVNASDDFAKEETLIPLTLPFGKQSTDYVISNSIEGERMWTTAVPAEISNSLIKMCRLKGIRPGRIQVIDTIEHRMAYYLGGLYLSPLWILLPQEPGIRLVTLQEGVPGGCYFFSNDPDFRIRELARLWMCQSDPPQYAVILDESSDYLWLEDFLKDKSVELLDPDHGLDFKQAMIGEWVKVL